MGLLQNVPQERHFAILKEYTTCDDDGWGGSNTRQHIEYIPFKTEAAMLAWIQYPPKNAIYRILESIPLTIETKVSILKPKATRSGFEDIFQQR